MCWGKELGWKKGEIKLIGSICAAIYYFGKTGTEGILSYDW